MAVKTTESLSHHLALSSTTAFPLSELEQFVQNERVRENAFESVREGVTPLVDQLDQTVGRLIELYDPEKLKKLVTEYWLYSDLEQHLGSLEHCNPQDLRRLEQRFDAYSESSATLLVPLKELLQQLNQMNNSIRQVIKPATEAEYDALAKLELGINQLSDALDLTPPGVAGDGKRMRKESRIFVEKLGEAATEFREACSSYIEVIKDAARERRVVAITHGPRHFRELEAQGLLWTERLNKHDDSNMVQLRVHHCVREILKDHNALKGSISGDRLESSPPLKLLSEIDDDGLLSALTFLEEDGLLTLEEVEKVIDLKSQISKVLSGAKPVDPAESAQEIEVLSEDGPFAGAEPKERTKARRELSFEEASKLILSEFYSGGRVTELKEKTLMTLLSRHTEGYDQRMGKQFARVIKELERRGVLELPQSRFRGAIKVNPKFRSLENVALQEMLKESES